MDEDRIELIRQLCTRIGMILEDASVTAILKKTSEDLAEKVASLCADLEKASALAAAAQVLSRD